PQPGSFLIALCGYSGKIDFTAFLILTISSRQCLRARYASNGMHNMKRRVRRRHPSINSTNWMQLLLQQLEIRIVPATFLVDDLSDPLVNVNDPLPGTLRYAVEQANSSPNTGAPDEITIIKMGKIPMSAPMAISDAVILDPFGASEVLIDMSDMSEPGPAF